MTEKQERFQRRILKILKWLLAASALLMLLAWVVLRGAGNPEWKFWLTVVVGHVLLMVDAAYPEEIFYMRHVSEVKSPEPTELYYKGQMAMWLCGTVVLFILHLVSVVSAFSVP